MNALFHFVLIFEFVVPLLEKQLELFHFKKNRYSTTGEFVSIIARLYMYIDFSLKSLK